MIDEGHEPGGERDETVVSPPPPTLEYSPPETHRGAREDTAAFKVGVFCGLFVPLLLTAEAMLIRELYAATGRHPGVPVAVGLAGGFMVWLALRCMRASHLSLAAVARGMAAGVLVLAVAIGAVLLLGLGFLYVMFGR